MIDGGVAFSLEGLLALFCVYFQASPVTRVVGLPLLCVIAACT